MKIAVPGKGGVGKTLISGALAHSLERDEFRDLIVDANPTLNLAYALEILLDSAFKIVLILEKRTHGKMRLIALKILGVYN